VLLVTMPPPVVSRRRTINVILGLLTTLEIRATQVVGSTRDAPASAYSRGRHEP
jgi:hypothetical protein